MTGETICEMLRPLIGKSGSIVIAVRKIGPIGLTVAERNKLTSVEVRPDGLIHVERETGWTVIDPDEVVIVAWSENPEPTSGQFL
jgi:hypothetical protein